jgi:mannose-6-phosphate isomerase
MSFLRLVEKRVEKVWGRRDLPEMFGGAYEGEEPLGEIWFEHPAGRDVELLVKYLFTSERLSIQVHPGDEAARRAGYPRGKEEAWLVLRAEPEAVIGLGLREPVSREALRAAALDGSIEALIDWRPVSAGAVYYSPAGTVHALGPGLTVVEIQQNLDLTYRLYDYGRPRELHLEEGVEASNPVPYVPANRPRALGSGRDILAEGRAFVLERWTAASGTLQARPERPAWLVPVSGGGSIAGEPLVPGTVWLADGPASLSLDPGSRLLVAYPGGEVDDALLG